jgi:hypothetical protein
MHAEQDDLAFLARFATTPDGEYLHRLYKRRLDAALLDNCRYEGNELYRRIGRTLQLLDVVADLSGETSKIVRAKTPAGARIPAGLATI